MSAELDTIKSMIRDIPDFPKPGIIFKDITPLLADGVQFQNCISLLSKKVKASGANKIAGLDARGFIFGAAVAHELGLGFIPIRKKGKLPSETISVSYDLEYGSNTVEMHVDAVEQGEKVIIIDDLLATGGTASAAQQLLSQAGAELVGLLVVIELTFLDGREKLDGISVDTLITY